MSLITKSLSSLARFQKIGPLSFRNTNRADIILYEQFDVIPPVGALISQKFQIALAAFDCKVADDFTVPIGETWTIKQVVAIALLVGGKEPSSFNVSFYKSSADPNIPEEIPFETFSDMLYFKFPPVDPDVSQYTITLLPFQVLTSGKYWVSIQANLESSPDANGNTWDWLNFGDPPIGSSAVFENPGDGFATGATTWTPLPDLVPNQIFALFGEKAFSPPCLHPMTQVMTGNGQKHIKEIKAGDYVFDHKGHLVKVVYNIVLGPKTNKFVKVPANSLKKGLPCQDLLIRKDHPILYRGKEVDPLKLARKLRKTDLIKEIQIEDHVDVYSLCTKERTFVMMQGLPVATWEQKDWEENKSKDTKFTWSKQ